MKSQEIKKKEGGFDPKEFLGAKVVSPLEQEKLLGGAAQVVVREVVERVVEVEDVT